MTSIKEILFVLYRNQTVNLYCRNDKARLWQCTNHRCSYGKNDNYSPLNTSGPLCRISCYIFSCCIFLCRMKITSLSETASSVLCLAAFLGHTLKKKVFLGVGKLGPIRCLVVCLCLLWNYLSVNKLNFMMFFFLLQLIFSLHGWYCPIRFSIEFHFHRHYIIHLISHHS